MRRSSLVTPSRRSAARTASIALSQARWARRMPATWAGVLARLRRSKPAPSARTAMPAAVIASAASSGKPRGTTASVTPRASHARTITTLCSASGYDMPAAVSWSKPSSSRPTASTSETAATLPTSKPVTQAFRRPSRSMKMPGSTIASGSSRRISGERTVSARMTMSGMSRSAPSARARAGRE